MATIKFFTRSTEKDRLATMFVRLSIDRENVIRIPTPYKMYPSFWDVKKQAIKKNVIGSGEFGQKEADEINDKLTELGRKIRDGLNDGVPISKTWLKNIVDRYYYKETPKDENLNDYIERFIREAHSGKRLTQSKKRYSDGSLRKFRDFQNAFDLFQGVRIKREYGYTVIFEREKKEPTRPKKILDWQDIDIDFYNDFVADFYSRNCSTNYVGKHINTLKTILRQAKEDGMPVNNDVEKRAFKAMSAPVDNIYLTEDELQKLFKLDLSKEKHLDDIRDVFLCGCYIAQRYSDYSHITKDNIKTLKGNRVIEITHQKKTGERCIIPIRPELEVILKKHNYNLPSTWAQDVNDNIKVIAERAKITDLISIEKERGGFKVKEKVKKCDLITTHTARRTGCTLMYLAGIPVLDIMKISGHKTPDEFLKYVRVGKEETAINLSHHTYFQGKTALKVV